MNSVSHVGYRRLLLGGILALIVVAALVWWMVGTATGKNLYAMFKLQGSYLVEGQLPGRTISQIGLFAGAPITSTMGVLVDYAPKGAYALVLSPDGRDEYFTKIGGTAEKLVTQGGIKSGLEVSSDGTYVAYSQLNSSAYSKIGPSTAIKDWTVSLYDVKQKFAISIPSAYQPQFFTMNGTGSYLAVMTPIGTQIIDLVSHKVSVASTTVASTTSVEQPTFISPDGAHMLAFSSLTSRYVLFTLMGGHPITIKQVGSFALGTNKVVGIDNDGLYLAVRTSTKTGTTHQLEYVSFNHLSSPAWTYTLKGDVIKVIAHK